MTFYEITDGDLSFATGTSRSEARSDWDGSERESEASEAMCRKEGM